MIDTTQHVLATLGNMKRYAAPGVFTHSLTTQERYSANAGDYFMHWEDEPLVDANGQNMILARQIVTIVPLIPEGA